MASLNYCTIQKYIPQVGAKIYIGLICDRYLKWCLSCEGLFPQTLVADRDFAGYQWPKPESGIPDIQCQIFLILPLTKSSLVLLVKNSVLSVSTICRFLVYCD